MSSEDVFDAHHKLMGMKVFMVTFVDTRKLRGAGGSGFANSRPADRIVTEGGKTFYAEIKSTVDVKSFKFSLIRKPQWGAAERQTRAGGAYYFFVHCLPANTWYRIPAQVVLDAPKRSLKFVDLHEYIWRPKLCAS